MNRHLWVVLIVVAIAAVSPYLGIPSWTPALATMVASTALSLIGLNLIFGEAGMLSLGHAAMAVLPAYVAVILQHCGLPCLITIPVGLLVAVGVARTIGEVFIRLPGIYFAIGTLGFAFVVEGLARAFPAVTGGASGLVMVLPVSLSQTAWYLLSVIALVAGLAVYAKIVNGSRLRSLKLVRHDELSAEVLGVDVARTKIRVFTIGSAYAAVGGLLLAYFTGIVVPENGGVNQSLEHLATTIIGGAGSVLGPLFGEVTVQWLFSISGGAERYELLIYGLAFFLILLFARHGLNGVLSRGWLRLAALLPANYESHGKPEAQISTTVVFEASGEKRTGVCLVVEQVTKRFGGLVAVAGVNLAVEHGQIIALIGPNGAGKSTLFNVINGIEQPDHGRVLLDGRDITRSPIHKRALTTGRSFQTSRLVPEMTALQNVAARLDHLPGHRDERQTLALARHQLAQYGLDELADHKVSAIGIGYHKLIDVARASAGLPSLLLLDEPAVGMSASEVQHLGDMLVRLKNQGVAILLVEHNFDFVKRVADALVVLDGGRVIAEGAIEDVMASAVVQEAYFGVLV